MYGVLLAFHLLICLGLIAVVLVQSGKGGGLAGGAFGGTAQTVFGGRGATDFITRATMILGGLFFVTSLVLALMSSTRSGRVARSLIQDQARQAAPAAPAQRPPAGGAGSVVPAPGQSGVPAAPAAPATPQTPPASGGSTPPAGGP